MRWPSMWSGVGFILFDRETRDIGCHGFRQADWETDVERGAMRLLETGLFSPARIPGVRTVSNGVGFYKAAQGIPKKASDFIQGDQLEARQKRLRDGPIMTLYHATEINSCRSILEIGPRPGTLGELGPAMYFTDAVPIGLKTINSGCLLVAKVRTGKVKQRLPCVKLTNNIFSVLESLLNAGFDTSWARAGCLSLEPEYAVHFMEQIMSGEAFEFSEGHFGPSLGQADFGNGGIGDDHGGSSTPIGPPGVLAAPPTPAVALGRPPQTPANLRSRKPQAPPNLSRALPTAPGGGRPQQRHQEEGGFAVPATPGGARGSAMPTTPGGAFARGAPVPTTPGGAFGRGGVAVPSTPGSQDASGRYERALSVAGKKKPSQQKQATKRRRRPHARSQGQKPRRPSAHPERSRRA